jgi:hypothetical protein
VLAAPSSRVLAAPMTGLAVAHWKKVEVGSMQLAAATGCLPT